MRVIFTRTYWIRAVDENVGAISVSRDEVGRTQKHGLSAVEGKVQPTHEGYFRRR